MEVLENGSFSLQYTDGSMKCFVFSKIEFNYFSSVAIAQATQIRPRSGKQGLVLVDEIKVF
jgi:hypothetical protein